MNKRVWGEERKNTKPQLVEGTKIKQFFKSRKITVLSENNPGPTTLYFDQTIDIVD